MNIRFGLKFEKLGLKSPTASQLRGKRTKVTRLLKPRTNSEKLPNVQDTTSRDSETSLLSLVPRQQHHPFTQTPKRGGPKASLHGLAS